MRLFCDFQTLCPFFGLACFLNARFENDFLIEQKRTIKDARPRHSTCMFFAWWSTIGLFCSDVFPKMWSEFIGCTKSFAASCISSSDLSQFNRAVGNSINSVHKMCTNEDYQKGKYLFNNLVALQWSRLKNQWICTSSAVQKQEDDVTMHAKNVTETQIDFGSLLICLCQQFHNVWKLLIMSHLGTLSEWYLFSLVYLLILPIFEFSRQNGSLIFGSKIKNMKNL